MKRFISIILSIFAAATLTIGLAGAASAESNLVHIGKKADRSASHVRVFVRVRVECSPDTTDATLTGTLTQVTNGGTQSNTGTVVGVSSFECTGAEERVLLPVRRPTGGFNWRHGDARVSDVCFTTTDPTGTYSDQLSGRTITVKR
jgi:hypothetical protein